MYDSNRTMRVLLLIATFAFTAYNTLPPSWELVDETIKTASQN